MITPRFNLSQTDAHIIIVVTAPYTNVKNTEIDVNEDSVIFYSTPYYLRLTLPGKVEEADDSSANYNADDGKYTITLNKVTRGEHFPNLEMLTTLLQPKSQKSRAKPLIEVISGGDGDNLNEEEITEDDWFIEQILEDDNEMGEVTEGSSSAAAQHLLNNYSYGFLQTHSGLHDKYSLELGQVCEISNPDTVPLPSRRKLREEAELNQFSDDHYLADLMENEEVHTALQFNFDLTSLQTLSDQDTETLKNLANRQWLIDGKTQVKQLHLGMVDILFGYCYDWRITDGKHCCESPWNISRLSGTLSWFDVFDSVQDLVHCSMRRSLSYPLLRHWHLSQKVMSDVLSVLKCGPLSILICFLDIRHIFAKKEPYYLLNQLYIEEYCIWLQKITPNSTTLASIITALEKIIKNYTKSQANLDLVELEAAAEACEEEAMEEDISQCVSQVKIN